jgi:hypothetical protein
VERFCFVFYCFPKVPNPDVASDVAADSYEDITANLGDLLQRAPSGHTFLAEGFTMEDAMHGWEVMSPKMDTGVGFAETKLWTEVEARDLTEEEAIGVMDEVLSLELVLYRGYTAAHTVATCHLLSSVDLARDKTLHLYLRAVLSCIQAVVELVRAAEISFEEELIRISADFDLEQVDADARPALLKELQAAEASLAVDAKAGSAHAMALRLRLTLRRSLLELLAAAAKGGSLTGLRERVAAVSGALSKVAGSFSPQSCPAWAIEEHLVRRDLGSATPARAIPKLDGSQMSAELSRFLEDIGMLGNVPDTLTASLEDVAAFAVSFSARNACVIARSLLRRFLTSGDTIMGQPALTAMHSFLALLKCPKHYMTDERTVKQNLIGAQIVMVQHWFMYLCLNPARQRRRLRSLLREGAPMLPVCAELDRQIATEMERRSKFFQFFTASQMVVNTHMSLQYLKLGAQLQLYETDELESVYWYIWHLNKELDGWKG